MQRRQCTVLHNSSMAFTILCTFLYFCFRKTWPARTYCIEVSFGMWHPVLDIFNPFLRSTKYCITFLEYMAHQTPIQKTRFMFNGRVWRDKKENYFLKSKQSVPRLRDCSCSVHWWFQQFYSSWLLAQYFCERVISYITIYGNYLIN